MNTKLTALTRPRSRSGVVTCTRVWRMTMLTMSNPPAAARATSDSHKLVEIAKTTVAKPKPATQASIRLPAHPLDRVVCQKETDDGRAHARGAAKAAEAERTDGENVFGINRQERRHAPQKNGEEIERDQAEQQAVRPDITNSGQNARIGDHAFRVAGRARAAGKLAHLGQGHDP